MIFKIISDVYIAVKTYLNEKSISLRKVDIYTDDNKLKTKSFSED